MCFKRALNAKNILRQSLSWLPTLPGCAFSCWVVSGNQHLLSFLVQLLVCRSALGFGGRWVCPYRVKLGCDFKNTADRQLPLFCKESSFLPALILQHVCRVETPNPLRVLCSGTYSKCQNIMVCLFLEKWETTVGVKKFSWGFFSSFTQLLGYNDVEEKRKKTNKIP